MLTICWEKGKRYERPTNKFVLYGSLHSILTGSLQGLCLSTGESVTLADLFLGAPSIPSADEVSLNLRAVGSK